MAVRLYFGIFGLFWAIEPPDFKNQSIFPFILQCSKGSPKSLLELARQVSGFREHLNDCKTQEEIVLSLRPMGHMAQNLKKNWRKNKQVAVTYNAFWIIFLHIILITCIPLLSIINLNSLARIKQINSAKLNCMWCSHSEAFRQYSLYSLVQYSSDEIKMYPTRKIGHWSGILFFSSDMPKRVDIFFTNGPMNIVSVALRGLPGVQMTNCYML